MEIEREYKDNYIIYNFLKLPKENQLDKIIDMVEKDSQVAYSFILNFDKIEQFGINIHKFMRRLYMCSVSKSCEIVLCGLNPQPKIVLEVLKIDQFYMMEPNKEEAISFIQKRYQNALYNY